MSQQSEVRLEVRLEPRMLVQRRLSICIGQDWGFSAFRPEPCHPGRHRLLSFRPGQLPGTSTPLKTNTTTPVTHQQSPAQRTKCLPPLNHIPLARYVDLFALVITPNMDSFKAFELAGGLSAATVRKRQQGILAIPTTYLGLNSGPQPGILVAIVVGTIAGFLLIVYLIYAIANFGGVFFNRRRTVVREEVVEHRSTSSRRRRPRVYEEDVFVERRTSRRPASTRVRETSRGDVEGEVCIYLTIELDNGTHRKVGYFDPVIASCHGNALLLYGRLLRCCFQ